jgi:ADP-heptose:LPS heptosyltransferase
LNGKASSLAYFQRFAEALDVLEHVLRVDASYVPALANKGLWLTELHRYDEALAAFGQARTLDPLNADAEWNLSFLHLLLGNFEAGWAEREARWRAKARSSTSYPDFAEPRWLGKELIEGKTILIYAEEGLGDAVQFARYIPGVAALGAKVILVAGEPLRSLLSEMPDVSQCLAKPMQQAPKFDYHCAISSLPGIFGTRVETIPTAFYLPRPSVDRVQGWENRLGAHDRPRVGLVWSGSATHKNDRNRSIPLKHLCQLLDTDAAFFSLQKDPRPEDKAALAAENRIADYTESLADFNDTAALLGCLDLVITVDTSVAHLSGALGRPTWILLPYTPDYRWLLGRDDSPWYPTVKLFRQGEDRDYADVLDRVRAELVALAAQYRPAQA